MGCEKLVNIVLAGYTKSLLVCGIIKTKIQAVFVSQSDFTSGFHWYNRK